MEPRSGMYSGVQPGALALEMSVHRSPPPRNPSSTATGGHHESSKHGYQLATKSAKSPNLAASDDDDEAGNTGAQWQRMKWTDNMVRLLIMVVFYIGDEVVTNEVIDKKKKQGKGKWKTVSRAMMERGFNVSPQQCEDKFNDLNKRYKRVNDILGKGTACRVVEDQSLLDSMDHLSPKTKEEVRKMINSKHLFFREMCAYHNSCGHGSNIQEVDQSQMGNPPPVENNEEDEDEDEMEGTLTKRGRDETVDSHSPLMQRMEDEVANVLEDVGRGPVEKRRWLRAKLNALEEDRVGISLQTLELEKRRLKWLKFSTKKEMELEKEKLVNERAKLENEGMALFLQWQELELIEQQQKSCSRKRHHYAISG